MEEPEAKRPSEEGRMILEVATNGVSWVQELDAISLSHTNLTPAENVETKLHTSDTDPTSWIRTEGWNNMYSGIYLKRGLLQPQALSEVPAQPRITSSQFKSTFLHYAEVQRKTDSCGSGIAARAERRASEPAGRAASTGGDTAGPDCAGSLRRVPDFGFAAKKARAFSSHRVRA
ncbi:hypothetical protein MG293_000594 [Ovis ammon polii]|uniref:Uncharacterized protein n=1 Tax=Ovis ammon polii TaxID=230172 RepID=A0AAD4UNX1_OVIAM|nr:hypothetical protein MG293_000594 [Ovis ammon polii]